MKLPETTGEHEADGYSPPTLREQASGRQSLFVRRRLSGQTVEDDRVAPVGTMILSRRLAHRTVVCTDTLEARRASQPGAAARSVPIHGRGFPAHPSQRGSDGSLGQHARASFRRGVRPVYRTGTGVFPGCGADDRRASRSEGDDFDDPRNALDVLHPRQSAGATGAVGLADFLPGFSPLAPNRGRSLRPRISVCSFVYRTNPRHGAAAEILAVWLRHQRPGALDTGANSLASFGSLLACTLARASASRARSPPASCTTVAACSSSGLRASAKSRRTLLPAWRPVIPGRVSAASKCAEMVSSKA